MFSEHVELAETVKQAFVNRIDDERKVYSLEVNVLDLKTFEVLLMDRQAIIGVDEAERISNGDDSVVETLLAELCRQVHTPLYDRRKLMIQMRQHLYGILDDAGLLSAFRKEFLRIYDEKFHEEERTDDRSRLLEAAMEVDWLKSRIAEQLRRAPPLECTVDVDESSDDLVSVDISGEQITIEIPESTDEPAENLGAQVSPHV